MEHEKLINRHTSHRNVSRKLAALNRQKLNVFYRLTQFIIKRDLGGDSVRWEVSLLCDAYTRRCIMRTHGAVSLPRHKSAAWCTAEHSPVSACQWRVLPCGAAVAEIPRLPALWGVVLWPLQQRGVARLLTVASLRRSSHCSDTSNHL